MSFLFGPSGGYLDEWYKRLSLWYSYYPVLGRFANEQITPYVELYLGMDQYNVQFAKYRSMLRLGFATRTSRQGPPAGAPSRL